MEKEENAGDQHFLLFPIFSNAFLLGVVKSRDCLVKDFKGNELVIGKDKHIGMNFSSRIICFQTRFMT